MRGSVAILALALAVIPTAAACEGLSPGDNLVADGASCTLAFLVADPTGLYFMTAGHCIAEGSAAENPDLGVFGQGAFTFLEGSSLNGEGSPGNDFALIRIDPAFYDKLNPKMCGWDGPTGGVFREDGAGGNVRHYGYGTVLGDTEVTRAREGTNLQYDGGDVFTFLGAGVPGDSGSAVIHANGQALGVLTHLGASVGYTNTGLHMDRAFALAAEAGYRLRLVEMGEDPVAVLRAVVNAPPPAPTPGNGTSVPTDGNTTAPSPSTRPSNSSAPSSSPPPRDTTPTGSPAGDGLDAATSDDARNPVPGFDTLALVGVAAALVAAKRKRT